MNYDSLYSIVKDRSRDDVVVGALTSHQCGLGLIPRGHTIRGLSFLLVLVHAQGFFSGYSSSPPSTKNKISKFRF